MTTTPAAAASGASPGTGLRLFHSWLSSASRRVRLCLAEKGLDYESIPIDLGRQEQHSPAFLAMNPNGVVPALRLGDGRSLHESGTICEYLDDCHPTPPLRPSDPFERAQMRNFIRYTDDRILPNLLVLNWSIALQPNARQWSDVELAEKLERIPTQERRDAWLRIARRPYTDEEKATATAKLVGLVDRMEAMLAEGPWLVGGTYSLADIAATPFVARIAEIAPASLEPATHPRVAHWWAAIRSRPAFAQARLERFDEALARR